MKIFTAHKNLKLFITHCGIMSLIETVYFGVPIIGIPFFGDQIKNMRHVKTHGYGVEMDFYNITEDYVYELINHVLENPS
jgi:glucuronosyltransferase